MANDPPPSTPPAATVHLPSALLDYRCNLRGCCCGQWQIQFTGDDLLRLAEHLPEDELPTALADGLVCVLDTEAGLLDHFELALRGEEQRCRFLAEDGGCGIQRRFGVEALPAICVDFPVVVWRLAGRVELGFSPVCPAVLDTVFAGRGPLTVAALPDPPDAMFARRLERVTDVGRVAVGGVELDEPTLFALRQAILDRLQDVDRPALEHLQAVSYGFATMMHAGSPAAFALQDELPVLPFVRYFHHALASHESSYLAHSFARYRRFVFDEPLRAASQDLRRLTDCLERWPEGLVRHLEPAEPALRPWLNRFLALRYFNCVGRFEGELVLTMGRVAQTFATALRFAAAFGLLLDRPVDRPLLEAALGAASYLAHNDRQLPHTAVWFLPEHFSGEEGPPPQWSEAQG